MNTKLSVVVLILAISGLIVATAACDDRDEAVVDQKASAEQPSAGQTNTRGGSEHYSVKSPSDAIAVGKKSQSDLAIEPTGDLKINEEFPWRIDFAEHDAVQMAQGGFEKGDLELAEDSARAPLLVEAAEAGNHKLEATADFSVCTERECFVMRDESLTFEIEAEEANADKQGDDEESEESKKDSKDSE